MNDLAGEPHLPFDRSIIDVRNGAFRTRDGASGTYHLAG